MILIKKDILTDRLSLSNTLEPLTAFVLVCDIENMRSRPHVLAKIHRAIFKPQLHVLFGLLGAAAGVRKEIEVELDAIKRIAGGYIVDDHPRRLLNLKDLIR